MIDTELAPIEADVVITFVNSGYAQGQVLPFWECDLTHETLHLVAQRQALQFAEGVGGGDVTYTIHDFR